MRPHTLRTDLTLSYAGGLALFLAAHGFTYYHVFARQLDVDATAELADVTRGVHGYIRFQVGKPALEYDRDDSDKVAFVQMRLPACEGYDSMARGRLTIKAGTNKTDLGTDAHVCLLSSMNISGSQAHGRFLPRPKGVGKRKREVGKTCVRWRGR